MATLKFPRFVLRNHISCEEYDNYRYLLKIPFTTNPQNTVLVILKNPSTATAMDSDRTADRVLNYAYKHGFDQVIIANLFAYRSTDSANLKLVSAVGGIQTVIGPENDAFINRSIREAKKIIIAWGTPPSGFKDIYNKRIETMLNFLKGQSLLYVDRISPEGIYPLHGQVWGYNMELKQFPS